MSIEFRKEMEKLASLISVDKDRDTVAEVALELQRIFGKSGSEALLIEITSRYKVNLEDAIKRPTAFQQALFFLLGDLGASFVMQRINQKVPTPQITGINSF